MARHPRTSGRGTKTGSDPEVGLCAGCCHARSQPNPRGSTFWRCALADRDDSYRRYPPLPVLSCPGFEPGGKEEGLS